MNRLPLLRAVDGLVDTAVGIAMIGELLIVIANVLGRYFFETPILWADECAGFSLSVIAFLGGAIAYRREQHVFVRAFVDLLPERARRACYCAVDWLVLEISVIAFCYSLWLVQVRWLETTPMLEVSAAWIVAPFPCGMVALAIYAVARLRDQTAHAVWTSFAAVAAATLAILTLHFAVPMLSTQAAIGIGLVAFLAGVFAGIPIAFALIIGTLLFLYLGGLISVIALPQNMLDGVGRFVLLALPFFILAGFVMEEGGISRRLIVFVASLVGKLRGGLLQVMVASMYLMSGLSGSSTADVAAVGLVMRDMLEKEGYSKSESAAVLAASAAMGVTVPPSIGIVVIGSITSVSTGALFAAGFVPAAVVAICLMALIYFRVPRSSHIVRTPATRKETLALFVEAIIPFSVPALLLAGIISGFSTPTEISAFAVGYGILIAMLGYREMSVKGLGQMIVSASTVSGMVLFTLVAAQAFSWSLAAAQVPNALASFVSNSLANPAAFMLASCVLMIALGSLLEGLPAILILTPLLMPFAPQLGIVPLHFATVLLIAMGIGAFLPPLGVGFYVACAMVRAPIDKASRIMIPYTLILFIGLMLVAFVPWFTLSVPRALGFPD